MCECDRLKKFFQNHPYRHKTFFERPDVSRRRFFEILGAGVTGSYLLLAEGVRRVVSGQRLQPGGA